jgi:hypothetical protein
MVMAGYAFTRDATPQQTDASVAIELLDGSSPGVEVILASYSAER